MFNRIIGVVFLFVFSNQTNSVKDFAATKKQTATEKQLTIWIAVIYNTFSESKNLTSLYIIIYSYCFHP